MKRQIQPLVFDDNVYDTIRLNIKKYRQEKGLTAAELAEMIGRSHDFMRQIESKKVGLLDYNQYIRVVDKILS